MLYPLLLDCEVGSPPSPSDGETPTRVTRYSLPLLLSYCQYALLLSTKRLHYYYYYYYYYY
jgi:hypothetical protein